MQRLFALLMALCLMTAPALAEDLLAQRAAELAARMDALAEDEAFLATMTASGDILVTIRGWAEGNHDTPARMFRVDTEEMLGSLAGEIGDGLSDPSVAELNRRLPISLPSLLCAHQGTVQLAAASICQVSEVFASQAQGSGMLMLLFEDTVPVLAVWRTENGAALMQVSFLDDSELAACTTAEQVSAWLAEQGLALTAEAALLP